jgi:DNA-binding beta-propeller fold protein YncE
VYVADFSNRRVQVFDALGGYLFQWSVSPVDIAVGADGTVYVADGSTGRVFQFDENGALLQEMGAGLFTGPRGLDVDPGGIVYVVDDSDHVSRISPDGALLTSWGGTGLGDGQFLSPHGIAIANNGDVLVPDALRTQRFTSDGTYIAQWPTTGDGIFVDPSGTVFVAAGGQVSALAGDGQPLMSWGSWGNAAGQFYGAIDIAIHGGRAYIVDSANSRIQQFGFGTVVTTHPEGLQIAVDGVRYTSPVFFDWAQGETHQLETLSKFDFHRQSVYDFIGWSDGGGLSHTFSVPPDANVVTASFGAHHWLEMQADPGITVQPASGWVRENSTVTITASVPDPFALIEWIGSGPGSFSGFADVATVVMQGPITEHAILGVGAKKAYDFTISASDTDPFVNTASPAGGIRNLYLWATCAPAGVAAFESGFTGSLVPLAFVPLNGVLNASSTRDLLLAVPGCPQGTQANFLLGYWIVDDQGGSLCLGPSLYSGRVVSVDCGAFEEIPDVGFRGFDSAGGLPCESGANGCFLGGTPGNLVTDAPTAARSPAAFALDAPRPNPFTGETRLGFSLPTAAPVRLSLFDVTGRLVARLLDEPRAAGRHEIVWDGRTGQGFPLPAGVYFASLEAGDACRTAKLVLVRVR